MTLTLAALVVLGAAGPEYSVVVARRLGVDAKKSAELAGQLTEALERQSRHPLGALVPLPAAAVKLEKAGFPDPSVCNGAAACVASLAKVSGFQRLVALQLVKIGADVAVDVSVIEGESGRTLAAVTRSVKLKSAAAELDAVAADLVKKLPDLPAVVADATPLVPPPLPPPDAPRDVSLTPRDQETPPTVAGPAPSAGLTTGRKVALGLGGAAVASLVAGIALGVSANGQAGTLSVLDPAYEQKASAVRQTALGADVAYGAAAALAVGAGVTWLLTGAPPPAAGETR